MQPVLIPHTPEDLAEIIASAASRKQTISLGGANTKRQMAGPILPADITISTTSLNRVLCYEPRDLTISVEAGLRWSELTRMLAGNAQMIPLDPPFAENATVGGVVASNASGPRRRIYGSARDLVIGMKFATLAGKIVQSGGMVVKNVAGLDMGKLMIGSFGTLAAIAVVNFKLIPQPSLERSFLLAFPSLAGAISARDAILQSVLQPAALDILSPPLTAHLGRQGYALAVRATGNTASIDRYEKEMAGIGSGVALDGADQDSLWRYIQNFTERFLDSHPDGAMVRVSCTLKELEQVLSSTEAAAIARGGSGVVYAHFANSVAAAEWAREGARRGWKAVVEFCPESQKERLELWPAPGGDFDVMQKVKLMFDPDQLLNRGRLYRRL